ncbi:MAG: xanthine dehydrogenase family protein subunit M [Deferrisomatales bacterium]
MLRVPRVRVIHPETVGEAVKVLEAEDGARVLGGGTDLLVALKYGLGTAGPLVAVGRLGIDAVEPDGAGWRIGGAATLWDLERWEPQGAFRAVVEAASLVGAPPIRSRATAAGNLCLDTRCFFYNQSAFWRSGRPPCRKAGGGVCHVVPRGDRCHACHQSDLAPALLAAGAQVEVAGPAGSRAVPVEALYSGDGRAPLTLQAGELVTGIRLPESGPGVGSAYEKLRMRRGLDFPAAAAAVRLARGGDGRCAEARVVLGAVASGPVRVPEAEQALVGSRLEAGALAAAAEAARRAARPVKNTDLTPGYRRDVVGALVERAARRAWARANGGGQP